MDHRSETQAAPKARTGWSSHTGPVVCRGCGEEWARDPSLEVPCPVCKVAIGTGCKRPSGHAAMELHPERDQAAMDAGIIKPCAGVAPTVPAARSGRKPLMCNGDLFGGA